MNIHVNKDSTKQLDLGNDNNTAHRLFAAYKRIRIISTDGRGTSKSENDEIMEKGGKVPAVITLGIWDIPAMRG